MVYGEVGCCLVTRLFKLLGPCSAIWDCEGTELMFWFGERAEEQRRTPRTKTKSGDTGDLSADFRT
jgi:hypothetical protein